MTRIHTNLKLIYRMSAYYDRTILYKFNGNQTAVEEFLIRTIHSTAMTFRQTNIRSVADIDIQLTGIHVYSGQINTNHIGVKYRRQFCKEIKWKNKSDKLATVALFTV